MSSLARAFFVLAISTLATASVLPRHHGLSNQCNTGSLQCCDSAQRASSEAVSGLLGLLGIAVDPLTALVGVTCAPVAVADVSGSSCSAQPVCCTNNNFNGLVALGCSPVNLNL